MTVKLPLVADPVDWNQYELVSLYSPMKSLPAWPAGAVHWTTMGVPAVAVNGAVSE